jgi:DNA-binding NarL/FixJ family response regulator
MNGYTYLMPLIPPQEPLRDAPSDKALEKLPARQREILQLLAEGRTTKEIAFLLGVSFKTIETHRASLMQRLGIRHLPGLVCYAIEKGLISVSRPISD